MTAKAFMFSLQLNHIFIHVFFRLESSNEKRIMAGRLFGYERTLVAFEETLRTVRNDINNHLETANTTFRDISKDMKIILQEVGFSVKYLQIVLFLLVAMLCGYITEEYIDTVSPVTVKSQLEIILLSVLKFICISGALIRFCILHPITALVCFCLCIAFWYLNSYVGTSVLLIPSDY